MKPLLHFLKLKNTSIYQQLQLEEALLRTDNRNWCLLNEGSPPAIVMGISGKAEELIHFDRLQSNPVPVIRRFSGGGTVIVDENTLFVTLICNRTAVEILPFPKQILCWNGALYKPFVKGFQINENDYAIENKKFGGNAQYICKERWLHHSTLLWDFDDEKMDYLKIPAKMPVYRNKRGHSDFLCKLRGHIPSKETFFDLFLGNLGTHFSITGASMEEARSCLKKPHRKTTTQASE